MVSGMKILWQAISASWTGVVYPACRNPAEAIDFRYRFSELNAHNGEVETTATFELRESTPPEVRKQVDACLRFREEKQPRTQPNCGSVFKNPEGGHAARLIEVSGLKGAVRGGMQISPLHANFIVNRGEGTATDARALIEQAQERVFRDHGIRLELEVQHLKHLPFETLVPPPASSSPCLLYTSPSPRAATLSRMPSSA